MLSENTCCYINVEQWCLLTKMSYTQKVIYLFILFIVTKVFILRLGFRYPVVHIPLHYSLSYTSTLFSFHKMEKKICLNYETKLNLNS